MVRHFIKVKNYLKNQTIRKKLIISAIVTVSFILLFWGAVFLALRISLEKRQESSPPADVGSTGQVLGTGNISFKTYKGLDFPWGLSSGGFSTYTDWLSTKYEEAAMVTSFDAIKDMGVLTVGKFLFLDRMLVKDSSWGTNAYRTQWNPTYKANWEGLLKNVVKPRGMELVVTLLNPVSDTDRDPYNFEKNAFVPVFSGAANILGANVQNGDMTQDTSPADIFPDGWSLKPTNSNNTASYEGSDGTTGSPAKFLKLTSNSTVGMTLTSPKVSFTPGTLYALSATYKGRLVRFYTNYYDSSGNPISSSPQDWITIGGPSTNYKGYSDNWTTVTWPSRTANLPAGTAKIAISADTDTGGITSIGPVRIAPAVRNAKWKNYMDAIKEWVSMYGSNTEYGPAVAAWIGIKEVYDSVPVYVAHDFSRDLYQAIKSTGTSQPVGIDSSPLAKAPVTDSVNLGWYNDAADFYSIHIYKNDGILPDTSRLDKPFILGEFGADWKCPNGGIPPDNCAWTDVPMTDPVLNLTATRNFYQNALAAGAKTALAWEWVNAPVAAHTGGVHTLGPVGQWIKDWNPGGVQATPTPTPTSAPANSTATPTPAPANGAATPTPKPSASASPVPVGGANFNPVAPSVTPSVNATPPTSAGPATASNIAEAIPVPSPASPAVAGPETTNNSSWFQPVSAKEIQNLLSSLTTSESTSSANSSGDLGKTLAIVGAITAVAILMGIFTFVVIP